MLIKITDFDDALAELLKRKTEQTTGSKAVLKAAQNYPLLLEKLDDRDAEIADLRRRLAVAEQLINGARSAAARLLEKTSQSEMEI